MDYKIIRQPVCVNETVCKQSGEVPFDTDFTLPDYCPDIMKILKCRVTPRVGSKSIHAQNVTVDGHVQINVIYCNSENGLFHYEQMVPFSKTFECEEDLSDGFAVACVKTDYVNCRAVSERRVDIHGALSLNLSVKARRKVDVITDIDESDIQIRRQVIPALHAIGMAEKNLMVEEELQLSNAQMPIETVLQYRSVPEITEIKPIKNKVVVKGTLNVTVLYATQGEHQYQCYRTGVPFSQFLDVEGVNEDCRCEGSCEIAFLEIKTKHSEEDCRILSLNAKLCVSVNTSCDGEVPVISDAFSTRHNLSLEQRQVGLERITGTATDTYVYKETFDFTPGSLGTVVDYWVEQQPTGCKMENGQVYAEGAALLGVLAYDTQGNIGYYEKTADYRYEGHSDFEKQDCHMEVSFEPVSSSFTLLSDSRLELRCEYRVHLTARCQRKVPMLIGLTEDASQEKKPQRDASLVIYYAESGENLWDIAKRYNSNIEEVRQINGLEDEVVPQKRSLLIPLY